MVPNMDWSKIHYCKTVVERADLPMVVMLSQSVEGNECIGNVLPHNKAIIWSQLYRVDKEDPELRMGRLVCKPLFIHKTDLAGQVIYIRLTYDGSPGESQA